MTTREEMLKRKQLAKDIYWVQNSGEVPDSKINKMYKIVGNKINGDLSDEDYIYDELKSLSNSEIEKIVKQIDNIFESYLKEDEIKDDSFGGDLSEKLIISLKKSGKLSPNVTLKQFSDALNRNPIYKSLIKRIESGSVNQKILLPFYFLIDSISDVESLNLDYKGESIDMNDYLDKRLLKSNQGNNDELTNLVKSIIVDLGLNRKHMITSHSVLNSKSLGLATSFIVKIARKEMPSSPKISDLIASIKNDLEIEDKMLRRRSGKESISNLDYKGESIEEYVKEDETLRQMLPGYVKVGKKLKISKPLKDVFDQSVLNNIEDNIELPVDITLVTNSEALKKNINFSISCQSGKDKLQQKNSVGVAFNNLKIKYSCHITKEEKTQYGIILWCYSTKISNFLKGESVIKEGKIISGADHDHVKDQKINKIFKVIADLMDDIEENLSAELSNNILKIEIIVDEFEADQLCSVDLNTGKVIKSNTREIKVGTDLLK